MCPIIQKPQHAIVTTVLSLKTDSVFSSPMAGMGSSCPSPARGLAVHTHSPERLGVHLGIFVT